MSSFFDAFISYGRADSKAFATKLHTKLLAQGLKIWFDQNDIPLGVDFQNQIDDGIEKAHNFLFIIAPHSINSAYCRKEIELAIKRKKRIIPLLHVEQISQETWQQRNPLSKPEDWEAYKAKGLHTVFQNMHPTIGKINWVYFREDIDDFEQSFVGLTNLLRRHFDYVLDHTRFLAKALEWERHQKQTNYLLIREERQQAEAWLKRRFNNEQSPCIPTDLHCEFITESIKNVNNLMTQVFLSYDDEDKETMERIRNSLRRESITVWTNKSDVQTGEVFEEAIKRGIEQADNIVYLLSPDSIHSNYCQRELDLALSLNKRIIPILVRVTDLHQAPSSLRDLQYIDLTDNLQEEDYHLDESQLLRILHQDEAYYNEHKILLTKALKWQRQHNNPSILLRGYNLRHADAWLKVAQQRIQHPPTSLQKEFISASLQQPPAISLDVFISYSRADSDLARKLNEALQVQGKMTWFDQESIASGTDFQQEIYWGIKACDNFLFILSPRSVNSPYCKDEVEYAASLNKRFVTVLHREVNSADLHPELSKVQWIDFNQYQGDFNANFNQLVRTLDTDREHVHSHTKWLQRAIEWQQGGKSADLLLRGSEFAIAQNWLQQTEQQKKQPVATSLQQEFILASGDAIAAEYKKQKRQVAILWSLLGLVSIAFVIAVAASLSAFKHYKEAQREQILALSQTSEARFALNRNSFDALLKALQAETKLKQAFGNKADSEIQAEVLTRLGQAVYWVTERNRLEGHTNYIQSVNFSPDGKTIATASIDRTVKLWNQDGSLIQTIEGGEGHNRSVLSVSFSPNNQIFATASADKTVKLWNRNGKLLNTLKGHTGIVYSVSFSPDSNTIASASADDTAKLWNRNGKLLHTLTGHTGNVNNVSFSPDGNVIATASDDHTVRLWNREGKLLNTLKGHNDIVYSVSFSPDANAIATASGDNTVNLWQRDGKLLRTLTGHNNQVTSVSFSPDGQTIATASKDNTVKLWNREGKEISSLEGHSGPVNSLNFHPQGNLLASAGNDKVVIWQLKPTWLTILSRHTDRVNSVRFSPDGSILASASNDNTVKLWDNKGRWRRNLEGHNQSVLKISFSPDNQLIATASKDNTVKLWHRDGQQLATLKGHKNWVSSVTFSPDSQTIATASFDKTVKLWNRDGKQLATFKEEGSAIRDVSFSPDGEIIAIAGGDSKTAKLWNQEGKILATLKGHTAGIGDVTFSSDSQIIATGSWDKTVKLWNRDGKELATLKGHTASIGDVSFSTDGEMIATASDDKTVKLWNRNGTLITTLIGHRADVNSVSFNFNGKVLASASSDKTVILWNVENLNLDSFMGRGCDWIRDYLKTHPNIEEKIICP